MGRQPNTGSPVSRVRAGASVWASMGLQPFKSRPRIWQGARKASSPFTWAASVRLEEPGRSTSTTGVSVALARCQALDVSVQPPKPS